MKVERAGGVFTAVVDLAVKRQMRQRQCAFWAEVVEAVAVRDWAETWEGD